MCSECHRLLQHLTYNIYTTYNIWFEGSNAVVCAQMGNLSQIKQKQCTKSTTISLKSFVWFSLIILCSIKHLMALVPYLFAFRLFEKCHCHWCLMFTVWCLSLSSESWFGAHDEFNRQNTSRPMPWLVPRVDHRLS